MKWLIPFISLAIAGSAAAQLPADEATIRGIVQNEIDTWNKGDAVGYSKDFVTNGTFTNIRGQFFTGYDAFLKQHQVIFDTIFKNTNLNQRVISLKFVRPLTPVKVADVWVVPARSMWAALSRLSPKAGVAP